MAIEKVKDFFKQYGMDSEIIEFEVSSATVDLAATALGCEPERIAKTLSFMVNGQAVLVVAPGMQKWITKNSKSISKQKQKCFLLMKPWIWLVMPLEVFAHLLLKMMFLFI